MKYKRVLIYTAFLTAVVILVTAQTTKPMEEKSNEKCPQFLYTEKEIDKISEYIAQQYGEFEMVGHEVVSSDIHCDIVIVPPTQNSPIINWLLWGPGPTR